MHQIAYEFDSMTVKKILKGLAYSMTAAAALAGLQYFQSIEISNPFLASVVVVVVPALINAVNEWKKGVKYE
jgi:hypothetical protein